MIARLLLQNTIFVIAMGALLFASAGTLRWPSAWVFLVTSALVGPLCGWWLYRIDPGLLAERLRPVIQRDQPGADKAFMIAFMAAILVWLIAIGLDRRAVASNVPLALQALGFVLYLACTLFTMWVFRENSFAAPVVKLQAERAQHVISTGPYAYVRHPMYSGMLMFFAGVPLCLGSWWGACDRADPRPVDRGTHPHRGAHADRRTIGLCRLRRAGALPPDPRRVVTHASSSL